METPPVPSQRVLKRRQRFEEWLARRNAKLARYAKWEARNSKLAHHAKREAWLRQCVESAVPRVEQSKLTGEERALRGTRLVEANRIRKAMREIDKSPMAETVQQQNRELVKPPMAGPEVTEHIQKMIRLGILGTTDQDTIELLARGLENK